MSNHIHVYVTCDKCGLQSEGEADTTHRNARTQAKAQGWKLGKQRDLCGKCAAELAEAVRVLVQAGG